MSKLVMSYQIWLKLQKALDKVAVFLWFYLISIWIIGEGDAKKWEPIKENKCLFSLNYADDQVIIIAQDAEDLEFILKRLNKAYKEGGLTINFNKTEFTAINTDLWRKCHN